MEEEDMVRKIRRPRTMTWMVALAGATLAIPPTALAIGGGAPAQSDQNKMTEEAQKKLDGKQYKDVKVTVDNDGVATLTGNVDLYEYKADADRKAHKIKGVKAVRDEIQVSGQSVPDQ